MREVSGVCAARAELLAARADVLRGCVLARRAALRPGDAVAESVTGLLAAKSSLASLDAARAAGLRDAWPARLAAASGVC